MSDASMPSVSNNAARPRRWRRVGKGLLVMFGVLVVLFGIWHGWLSWQVSRELAAIRAAGYPATLAELEASYPPITGRNAAQVYEQAFAAHQYMMTDEDIPIVGGGDLLERRPWLDATQREAARAFLARNAVARRRVAEAEAIEYCRWPVSEDDFWEQRPHLAGMRAIARLLDLEATLLMHDGEHVQTLRTIADIKRIGDALRHEPLILGRMVQFSIYVMAIHATERMLAERLSDAAQLATLNDLLKSLADDDAALRTLASERAWGSSILADPALGTENGWLVFGLSGLTTWNRLVYLRAMGGVMDTVAREGANARPNVSEDDLPAVAFFAMIALPTSDDYLRAEQRLEIYRQAALVALAVERYRLAHDDWPARLEELVPTYLDAVPVDVFDPDGSPLRYAVRDDRAVIYSVGSDGVDHGGRARNPQTRYGSLEVDIPFTLWRDRDEQGE